MANIPVSLGPAAAKSAHFLGPVLHDSEFGARIADVLAAVKPASEAEPGHIVVIGGAKSAQEYVFLSPLLTETQRSSVFPLI